MKTENPPAFPFAFQERDAQGNPIHELVAEPGMSLRDYFAAKAMQAMASEATLWKHSEIPDKAYKLADAMLATRQPKEAA
jgi:hypothetical protein